MRNSTGKRKKREVGVLPSHRQTSSKSQGSIDPQQTGVQPQEFPGLTGALTVSVLENTPYPYAVVIIVDNQLQKWRHRK